MYINVYAVSENVYFVKNELTNKINIEFKEIENTFLFLLQLIFKKIFFFIFKKIFFTFRSAFCRAL